MFLPLRLTPSFNYSGSGELEHVSCVLAHSFVGGVICEGRREHWAGYLRLSLGDSYTPPLPGRSASGDIRAVMAVHCRSHRVANKAFHACLLGTQVGIGVVPLPTCCAHLWCAVGARWTMLFGQSVVACIFAGIRKYGNAYPYSVLYHAKVKLFEILKTQVAVLENRTF